MKPKLRISFPAVMILLLLQPAFSEPSSNCNKLVHYRIEVALDEKSGTLDGKERIIWRNPGEATDEVQLHFYMNAFKNNQSTFLRETFQRTPKGARALARFKDGWGYCEPKTIFAEAPGIFPRTDLASALQFIAPDDGNADDETVGRLLLPRAVPSGAELVLEIEFVTQLPRRAPRTGRHGDYFFAGQWFPKIGVRQGDRWNCHQYHASTEYFANYGDYEVAVTIPKNYQIGASGVQVEERAAGAERKTVVFRGECIHDFAWTASPRYCTAERTFQHPELPAVTMRLLHQPEHRKYVDRYFDATANTLKHLGLWYLPYPYPQITIVDAAFRSNVAGMEYPTLFTTGADWLEATGSFEPIGLTIHECTHQWFYGMLGSDETESAWLDEGFTVYAAGRCFLAAYGQKRYSKTYLSRDGFGIPWTFSEVLVDPREETLQLHRERGHRDKMSTPSYQLIDRAAYRNNAYEKPSLMLWTLEGLLGEDVFQRTLRDYVREMQFRHPTSQDFIAAVQRHTTQDMSAFFEQLLDGYGIVDYAVVEINAQKLPGAEGFFGRGGDRRHEKRPATGEWLSLVHVERKGEITLPVEMVVTFENGETVREKWDGKQNYRIFRYVTKSPIEQAQIDPERKIWLDVDPANNGRYRKSDPFPSLRWTLQWLFWLQHLMETAAVIS
ncbi:MAG: M1 family metallopeptidase [candidate division KSB1 bacterium]|nr:M1 family metallopeptidase [candidate division KSB1 bacterium]